MKAIQSPKDFEVLLKAERAILLIYFAWSAEAAASRQALERWEREGSWTVYELAPDEQQHSWKWVGEHAIGMEEGETGAGAVLWLSPGRVAGRIPSAAGLDGRALTRLTRQFFELGPASDGDNELLKILCCPETRQELTSATPAILEALNRQVATGTLRSRNGQYVQEKVEGGLVRKDGKLLYPIRQHIPILLVDEAIEIR